MFPVIPVAWMCQADAFHIAFTVPAGASATLHVQNPGDHAQLHLDGNPAVAQSVGRYLELEVPAGKHKAVVSNSDQPR
jgi:hypothetical protein